jgi:hypothetical protein
MSPGILEFWKELACVAADRGRLFLLQATIQGLFNRRIDRLLVSTIPRLLAWEESWLHVGARV